MKRLNKSETRRMVSVLFGDAKYQDVMNKLKAEWKIVTFKNGCRLREDIYQDFCDMETNFNK